MDRCGEPNTFDHIACNSREKDKIKSKLMDIKNANDLNLIDCNFIGRKINLKMISLHFAQERLEIWKIISKLSVYLMNDLDFFKSVIIKSAFKCPTYNTAMENLGYQRDRSSWTLVRSPDQETIIDYIFKYCFYSYIVSCKKSEQTRYNSGRNNFNYNPNKTYNTEINNYDRKFPKQFPVENKYKNFEGNRNNRNPMYTDAKSQVINDKFEPPPYNRFNDLNTDFQRKVIVKNIQEPVEINNVVDKWKCETCEMMNSYNTLFCAACDLKGPHYEKWRCPKCTFLNEVKAVNCAACHHINGTYIDIYKPK